jgi:hypothetical protein
MRNVTRAGSRPSSLLWGLALLLATLALGNPRLATAVSAPALPESDYTTHSACSAPTPGHASCMALELERRTTTTEQARLDSGAAGGGAQSGLKTAKACAEEFPSGCLTPKNLQSAYFPSGEPLAVASKPQTIALVDAYNDPKAEADLKVYSEAFGLPVMHKCSGSESGCFEQVNQSGTSPLPFPETEAARKLEETVCDAPAKTKESKLEREKREEACDELVEAEGWDVEISTDIEVAHAICQNCKILLVEANTAVYKELEEAEETAVRLGASEISNSWGGPQEEASGQAFNHPGTVITAAAGDDGYLNWTEAEAAEQAKKEGGESGYFVGADYPAASPDVVAVGGTKLTMTDGLRQSETVWNEDPNSEGLNEGAGGSGCSESFTAQSWQQAVPDWSKVGCGTKRAVADIAADADPYTGVAVYDSVPTIEEPKPGEVHNEPLEWWPVGGTSVASPLIGSMFALAGGANGVAYPAQTLYSHLETAALHDVTKGGNGKCDDLYTSCSGSMNPLSSSYAFDCGEGTLICNAALGCGDEYYDGPTGVGTPNGIAAFEPGPLPALAKPECEQKSKPSKEEAKTENTGSQGSGSEGSGGSEGIKGGGTDEPPAGGSPAGPTNSGSGDGTQGGSPSTKTSVSGMVSGVVHVSALELTTGARAAVRQRRVAVARLAFSCTLSRAATVRVVLSVQIHAAGHMHWRTLPASLTFNAAKGVNHRHLHGSEDLVPGTYRLTLTPAGGTARSITIRVA